MITGVHTMFYSSDADAARAFLRDKLQFPYFDAGGGWLIFKTPPCDMGIHPTDDQTDRPGTHNVSFVCDDIAATVAELERRGVEFTGPPVRQDYGIVTHFRIPGGILIQLYQPLYPQG